LPDFFASGEIDFYFSSDLLKEISSTLNYARSIKRINNFNYQKFLFFIRSSAVMVESISVVDICRDPKDNFLLAIAKDAKADYLITRDQDLLVLKKFENTLIVTLNEFIEIINVKPL